MRRLNVPKDIYTHISGIDLVRDENGDFFVLEDNLRTPSGVSYMLENREITRRLFPNFIPKQKVMPVSNYPNMLYKELKSLVNKKIYGLLKQTKEGFQHGINLSVEIMTTRDMM